MTQSQIDDDQFNPCRAPCVPIVCDDCPCVPFEARAKQFRDPLEYLQQKSDQQEPVKVPQYERD